MKHYRTYVLRLFLSAAILLFLVQPAGAGAEPATLTLSDSIALAVEYNPALKITQQAKEKAAWGLSQAKAHQGFTVGYSYTGVRTVQPPYAFTLKPIQPYDYFSHQVKLQLPLYTGGKVESSIDMAKHGLEISELAVSAAKQQLIQGVTAAYLNALQGRNLAETAQQSVKTLTAHLQNVRNHYEAGTVSLSDVLQTEVRLANARNNLIKAHNGYKLARYKLNKEIGLPLQNDAVLKDDISYRPYLSTLDESISTALANRPEIAQTRLKIAAAQDKVKIANAENLPTVGLVAMNTWDDKKSPGTENSKWLVGMSLQMNVFDNGLTRAQLKQARSDAAIAREQAQQTADIIALEVSQAYLGVIEASERIANNQVAVHQSETDYRLALERYENGIGTNLDVMDAELAMTRARVNHIQAMYDYSNSRAQLDKAMGIIQ